MSTSASSSSTSSKKSLSSLGYRNKNLAPAGIEIDGTHWSEAPEAITSVIDHLLDFSATVPAGTALANLYIRTNNYHVVASPSMDITVQSALYGRAQEIYEAALQMRDLPENRWTPVISISLETLLKDPRLHSMQETLWNAIAHPFPSAAGLPVPKPDFAVGFRREKNTIRSIKKRKTALKEQSHQATDAETDMFTEARIKALIEQPGLYLKPFVNETYYNVIYPFFCFEAKSPIGTNYAAANQLGGSLSFALGLLGQLRALATEDRNEPLLVFGATSSGRDFVVYVAYEADPLDGEMECVRRVILEFNKPGRWNLILHICLPRKILNYIWIGNIQDVGKAVEFLWIIHRVHEWAHHKLRPRIQGWLSALG